MGASYLIIWANGSFSFSQNKTKPDWWIAYKSPARRAKRKFVENRLFLLPPLSYEWWLVVSPLTNGQIATQFPSDSWDGDCCHAMAVCSSRCLRWVRSIFHQNSRNFRPLINSPKIPLLVFAAPVDCAFDNVLWNPIKTLSSVQRIIEVWTPFIRSDFVNRMCTYCDDSALNSGNGICQYAIQEMSF